MTTGRVCGIYTAPAEGAPMVGHDSIEAFAGKGLAGDRYAIEAGTYSGKRLEDAQRAVTLFERENLECLEREHGIVLAPEQTRRNLLVEGVAVNDLIGVEFTVGGVPMRGVDLAHPCSYLQDLTEPGVLLALQDRGGLRCEILADGTITLGDPVTTPD
ncbi:MAG: MOSC domain-containing protein [Actinobacteria bacterium]|nr:MOSC domain-containing protein [Actinomycetota bacterium]